MSPHLGAGAASDSTVRDSIARVVGHLDLAEELVSSIRAGFAQSPMNENLDALVAQCFSAAIDTVTLDIDSDPRNDLLKALLKEDWERTNTEVVQCLEFIYSHMVNKFKGDLAEFLAMRLCTELAQTWKQEGRLPLETYIVWGSDLRERREERGAKRDKGWHKGADGLFVVEERQPDGPHLVIFGIVEVKSYRLSYRRAEPQIRHHFLRLQDGLKIGEQIWSPDRLYFGEWNAQREIWSQTRVTATSHPQILRLLVVPSRLAKPPMPAWRPLSPHTFLATLPHTSGFLAAAAYNMTVWFIEQLGCRAFSQCPSPWPELTPQEAGVNAVKQALYYILLRDLTERAARIATRLYNVYGFGYDAAQGHRHMLWSHRGTLISNWQEPAPAMETPPGLEIEEIVERAWSFYRRGSMNEAMVHIDAAISFAPDEHVIHRLGWLRGMIHYFRAEFEQAAGVLPAPAPQSEDRGWVRDKLLRARLFVRLDRLDEAVQEMRDVSAAQLPDRSIPIAVPVCEAMVAMKQGRTDAARLSMDAAFDALQGERADIATREADGRGVHRPWALDAHGVSTLALDMVPVYVSLGDHGTALELLTHVRDVFPPYLLLMARDAALEPLRQDPEQGPRFQAWLQEQGTKAGLMLV